MKPEDKQKIEEDTLEVVEPILEDEVLLEDKAGLLEMVRHTAARAVNAVFRCVISNWITI